MSELERPIVCRQCKNTIDRSRDNCPHCGAAIRSRRGPIAALLIGIVIILFSIIETMVVFLMIGIIISLLGGYILYERRQRIKEAEASHAPDTPGSTEEA